MRPGLLLAGGTAGVSFKGKAGAPRMAERVQRPDNLDAGSQVSKAVTSRLSLYLRELQHLGRDGHDTTSSKRLGHALGLTGAQVRKDLANFGQFGYPGDGYRCQELIGQIKKILGTNRPWAAPPRGFCVAPLAERNSNVLGGRGCAARVW